MSLTHIPVKASDGRWHAAYWTPGDTNQLSSIGSALTKKAPYDCLDRF